MTTPDPFNVTPRPPAPWVNSDGVAQPFFYRWLTQFVAATYTTSQTSDSQAAAIATLQQQMVYNAALLATVVDALEVMAQTAAPTGGGTVDTQARAAINSMLAAIANL